MLKKLVVGLSAFILAVIGSIIASTVSHGLETKVNLFIYAILFLIAGIALLIGIFGTPSADTARVTHDFHNIWPKLYSLIRVDVKKSIELATLARTLRNGDHPPQYYHPKSEGMASDHNGTIRHYDPILRRALCDYLQASRSLHKALSNYKWEIKRADRPTQFKWYDPRHFKRYGSRHFKRYDRSIEQRLADLNIDKRWYDPSIKQQRAYASIAQRALTLEFAADNLRGVALRCSEAMGTTGQMSSSARTASG
jgi:hypothetical protein